MIFPYIREKKFCHERTKYIVTAEAVLIQAALLRMCANKQQNCRVEHALLRQKMRGAWLKNIGITDRLNKNSKPM